MELIHIFVKKLLMESNLFQNRTKTRFAQLTLREEIEIYRSPMPDLKRNRRAADQIERSFEAAHHRQKRALLIRQNAEVHIF